MRFGKLSQAVWMRSVGKQFHIRGNTAGGPIPQGTCSVLGGSAGESFLWASGFASGDPESAGYYALLHAAGELAAEGVQPSAASVHMLFPPEITEEEIRQTAAGLDEACCHMNMQVTDIRGEVTSVVSLPSVYVSAAGVAEKSVLKRNNAECSGEEEILFCGYAGLEGMLRILGADRAGLEERFVSSFLCRAKERKKELVLPRQILEAVRAVQKEGKTGRSSCSLIRQAGSGGILAALWEMAEILHTGLEVDLGRIALRQETVEICEYYRLNPYQMTSAGSYLIVTEDPRRVLEVLEKNGVRAGRLGVTKAQNARVITSGEEVRYLDRPAPDELARWMEERTARGGSRCDGA